MAIVKNLGKFHIPGDSKVWRKDANRKVRRAMLQAHETRG